jgi:hypothetical protein
MGLSVSPSARALWDAPSAIIETPMAASHRLWPWMGWICSATSGRDKSAVIIPPGFEHEKAASNDDPGGSVRAASLPAASQRLCLRHAPSLGRTAYGACTLLCGRHDCYKHCCTAQAV